MYQLRLAREVSRYLEDPKALPRDDSRRIVAAIRELAEDPRPRGSTKLKDAIHRLRVGAYRIIYHVNDEEKAVTVGRVARRREDTYRDTESLF